MTHAWCSDPARDEAVRAAEDGRSVPLPTLEEAIADPFTAAARCSAPVSKSGDEQSGIRTERITLEVTHDLDAPLGDWIVQAIDESLGYDESVRVVEEASAPPARGWLTEEERRDLWEIASLLEDSGWQKCADALLAILARSSPPESAP